MALTLTINGTDYTSQWRLYESRWTSRAFKGESMQSEFVLENNPAIPHADLASRKIIEVWEDASGSPVCLYRGRVANKTLGRPRVVHGGDHVWNVTSEDSNIDLRGLRVHESTRSEETDDVRVEAYRLGYLNGSSSTNPRARDSTTMGDAIVSANLVTLDANTYDMTDPFGVFQDIIEFTGKTFFVYVDDDGDMQLYYADHTDTSYASDISVVDTDLSADGVDIYAADLTPNAGDHDGQDVISGAGVDTPHGYYELSDLGGGEGFHDKWEEHLTDDRVRNESDAEALIIKYQGSKSNEDFRYFSTFYMTAENVHRLKAGMMVPLKRRAANKTTSTDQRAVQVTVAPHHPDEDGNPVYEVTTEYGVPRGTPFRRHFHRPVPKPPAQPVDGGSVRLYHSNDLSASGDSAESLAAPNLNTPGSHADASWEYNNGGSWGTYMMYPVSPQDTVGQPSWNVTNTAAGDATVRAGLIRLDEADGLLDIIQAGGTVKGQNRARSRFGTGISEAAQNHVIRTVGRIYRPGTGFVATLWSEIQGNLKFAAQSTLVNRSWAGSFTAYASAAGTDYLMIDYGADHQGPVSGGAGIAIMFNGTTSTDLPEDQTATSGRSWVELSGASASGSAPLTTVRQGEGEFGESGEYVPVGSTIEAGLLSDDGDHYFNASDIEYDGSVSGLAATDMQQAIDQLAAGAAAGLVAEHGTLGASEEFDASQGDGHSGTLDEDVTITLTGATDGEETWLTLYLTDDGSGPYDITWPGSVSWPGGVEPDPPPAGETLVVTLVSIDGGSTWYGSYPGTGSNATSGAFFTVDPGAPSYSGSGPVTVSVTSKFGIDSGGNPYYNAANVTSGEEAALMRDSANGTYFLRPYTF